MSDAVEPLDLGATQRRIDLTLKNVARYADRTGTKGERESIVSALVDAQDDVATLVAEVERLRAALTTARRDALTEAADAAEVEFQRVTWALVGRTPGWLRARAAREDDR